MSIFIQFLTFSPQYTTVCEICNAHFESNYKLMRHLTATHWERPEDYFCESCGKGFRYLALLQQHEKQCKNLVCPICKYKTKYE